MNKRVGVFNAPPIYVTGLAKALLSSEYDIASVTNAESWLKANSGQILLLMVSEPEDLDLVVDLREESPDATLVTLLDSVTADRLAASLRAGATGSVGLFSSSAEVVLAIQAANNRKVVIPTRMARSMMKSSLSDVDRRMLSEIDVEYLRALADGEKVGSLARRFDYSEREMYRRLRRLYNRMSVRGRTEALLLAARWGVID